MCACVYVRVCMYVCVCMCVCTVGLHSADSDKCHSLNRRSYSHTCSNRLLPEMCQHTKDPASRRQTRRPVRRHTKSQVKFKRQTQRPVRRQSKSQVIFKRQTQRPMRRQSKSQVIFKRQTQRPLIGQTEVSWCFTPSQPVRLF